MLEAREPRQSSTPNVRGKGTHINLGFPFSRIYQHPNPHPLPHDCQQQKSFAITVLQGNWKKLGVNRGKHYTSR